MAEEQVAEAPAEVGQAPSETTAVQETSWKESLPEEIRGHKSLETISDVGSLAKSFVHAESMIGSDKIPVPGKWATDDDWSVVYNKLGRPEASGDYKLEASEAADADTLDWFKSTAHKIGLNSSQAQNLLNEYEERMGSHAETSNSELEDLVDLTTADGVKFGDHPDIIKMFANVGDYIREKIGEDSIAGPKGAGVMAPDEAQQKLAEIRKQGSPYWDVRHPEHDWYVNEALKFGEMLTPEDEG